MYDDETTVFNYYIRYQLPTFPSSSQIWDQIYDKTKTFAFYKNPANVNHINPADAANCIMQIQSTKMSPGVRPSNYASLGFMDKS